MANKPRNSTFGINSQRRNKQSGARTEPTPAEALQLHNPLAVGTVNSRESPTEATNCPTQNLHDYISTARFRVHTNRHSLV